jgi:DNA polymerase-3 subunit delta'
VIEKSTLFIVNDIDGAIADIVQSLPRHSVRVIRNEDDSKNEFLIEHARRAVKEAYISTEQTKYIILCGDAFRVEAQNALLKVLEEPPANIIFLLITLSKNAILPTILSRVQLKYQRTKKNIHECSLNLAKLDLKEVYSFLKQHQRISKAEAKELVESILYTIHSRKIALSSKELEGFSKAMKLLELNSRPINVLTTLMLSLMNKR